MNPRYTHRLKRIRRIVELMEGRPDDPEFPVEGSYFKTLLEIIEEQDKEISAADRKLAAATNHMDDSGIFEVFGGRRR